MAGEESEGRGREGRKGKEEVPYQYFFFIVRQHMTRHIAILSIRPSVRDIPVLDENGFNILS